MDQIKVLSWNSGGGGQILLILPPPPRFETDFLDTRERHEYVIP